MEKLSYVSPPHGVLAITVIRDANPRITLALDLGIPNFTVFSMNLPLAEGQPREMSSLIAEAVSVLCDEVASFMLSLEFKEKIITNIYAQVLATFKTMSTESDPSKEQDAIGADPTVQIYEGTFAIPMDFINETQNRVVTASTAASTIAYTVGAEQSYDKNLATGLATGDPGYSTKMGRRDDYEGGWVWRTADEAQNAINRGIGGDVKYAVYKLKLPNGWDVDTYSQGTDVHFLVNDARIVGKAQKSAAVKITRQPVVRHVEFTYSPKQKTKPSDTARVIRQYRNRSLKQQPKPMFVIVYDQMGRATGTIPIGTGKNFKNELLKAMKKKSSLDFTAPVSFTTEQEMKSSPLSGIPRAVSVGGMTYQPEATAGIDMALYHGPQDWIVKFPDGRTSVFPGRPTFNKMRTLNFPVPRNRFKWTMIPEDALQQDEKFEGLDAGDEPEAEPTLQTLTPQSEVKEAATPEPAPEPKLIEERYLTAKKLSTELDQMQNGTTKEWRGVTIERMNDHWLVRVGLGGVTLGKTPMAAAKYAVRFANALASGAWGSTVAPPRS